MKKVIIFLFVIILIGLGIYSYFYFDKPEFKKEISINVGDKIPTINDYINNKKKTSKIKWNKLKSEKGKVFKIGTYKGAFTYNNKKYNVYLKVKDNIKPTIKNLDDIEVYEGSKVDFYENVEISDNSHDKLTKKIEGKYDLNKVGTYNLTMVVSDKAGNITKKEFKLTVKEKKNETKNETKKISSKTSKGYKIENKNGLYYINGLLIANKTYSLPSSYNPGGLLNVFNTNFNTLKNDAAKAGINLNVISGFRSYATQNRLYNNYAARDGYANADRYSARPGHSEHQTGLAADINSVDQAWINTKEGKWLNENCYKYGFIIRYPKGKENITGYMYEPWHIRYVGADIASKLYNNGNWITLEEYLGIDSKY